MSEEIILYGVRDNDDVSLYFEIEEVKKDRIDVSYGTYCGNIKAKELPDFGEDEVIRLTIKAEVIGKEMDFLELIEEMQKTHK